MKPDVYAHTTSPVSGTSDITSFLLVFGRDAPSTETISLHLPASAVPDDHYAAHRVSHVKVAHAQFQAIKADLRRRQRELHDTASRNTSVLDSKTVYLRKDAAPAQPGLAARFLCSFYGPYLVIGHTHNRTDLLTLTHAKTSVPYQRPLSIEKIIVVLDPEQQDLRPLDEALLELDVTEEDLVPRPPSPILSH